MKRVLSNELNFVIKTWHRQVLELFKNGDIHKKKGLAKFIIIREYEYLLVNM
jgi:hypothetical protein